LITTFTRGKEEMLTFDLPLYVKIFLLILMVFFVLVIHLYVNDASIVSWAHLS